MPFHSLRFFLYSTCSLMRVCQAKNPDTVAKDCRGCCSRNRFDGLRPTQLPSLCSIAFEKESWLERKTQYAFGLTPLSHGIEFKELEVGLGPEAMKGHVISVGVTYYAAARSRKLERWRSLLFILGEEYRNVPFGLHIAIEGMRMGGRRLIVLPPEMMEYRWTSPVFVEIVLQYVSEPNALSAVDRECLGHGIVDRFLIKSGLQDPVNSVKSWLFGIQYVSEKEWQRRKEHEVIPAETEEEFFGETKYVNDSDQTKIKVEGQSIYKINL